MAGINKKAQVLRLHKAFEHFNMWNIPRQTASQNWYAVFPFSFFMCQVTSLCR